MKKQVAPLEMKSSPSRDEKVAPLEMKHRDRFTYPSTSALEGILDEALESRQDPLNLKWIDRFCQVTIEPRIAS